MKKMFLFLAIAANSSNGLITSVSSGIVTFYFFTLRATFPQNFRLLNVEKLNLDKSIKNYRADL